MAKELPFFKFTPDEWLTGDITLEEFEAQGLFVNICAYYWKRDCSITIAHLYRRYSTTKKELFEVLFSRGILKKDEYENVRIAFLDEQWEELNTLKHNKVMAGKAGAAKRWQNHSTPIVLPMAENGNKDIDIEVDIEVDKDKERELPPQPEPPKPPEQNTPEPIKKITKELKHSFEKSPCYPYDKFADALKEWPEAKIRRYYERAIAYSGANGGRYLNWILAVKAWARKDEEKQGVVKPPALFDVNAYRKKIGFTDEQ